MSGNTLRDLDTDGHDLAIAEPDARIAGEPARRDPEVGEGVDQATLEVAQVETDIRLAAEVEDRIADQLPRSMVGDVAAAIDLEAGDAARRERGFGEIDMVAGATPAAGGGVRMREQH